MGAVAGSMEAARQFYGMEAFGFGATWEDHDCDVDAAKPEPKSPVSRAKSAAKTLMADVESASAHLAGAADKVADAVARPAGAKPSASNSRKMAASPRVAGEGRAANVPEILPEDFRKPHVVEKPKNPDDLKLISGIGPKLEQVLNGLGVWTFGQIAGWEAEEIAWLEDYLGFGGRIGRDEWLRQAGALAGKTG
jgi:NADH-quinone oxidoreductase subunit E